MFNTLSKYFDPLLNAIEKLSKAHRIVICIGAFLVLVGCFAWLSFYPKFTDIERLNKEIEDKFIALKVEAYYDIIKELIFAHLYRNGYNCTNHLCLIAYLKEKIEDFDFEIQKINELRKVRNEINYRGLTIKKDYLNRNELEFKNIIKRLN